MLRLGQSVYQVSGWRAFFFFSFFEFDWPLLIYLIGLLKRPVWPFSRDVNRFQVAFAEVCDFFFDRKYFNAIVKYFL